MTQPRQLVIVGAGPAGLSAAVYAGRADIPAIVVERAVPGGQVAATASIANYPGFPEGVDGYDLAERMKRQAERFGVGFLQAEATDIERFPDGRFRVTLTTGEMEAEAVILATGADPKRLGIPGEDEFRGRGVSYCATCDGPFFRGKRLAVAGGGDSAMKESLELARFASSVLLVNRKDRLGGERSYRREILANPKITLRHNSIITEIHGRKTVEAATVASADGSGGERIETDGVFVFIGSTPNSRLACRLLPFACGETIPADERMRTPVPGLFVAGDLRRGSLRQIATAVGEGATAALAAGAYLDERGAEPQ